MNKTDKILVICPSHNRPAKAAAMAQSFKSKTALSCADLLIVCEENEVDDYRIACTFGMIKAAQAGARGMARPFNEFALRYYKEYAAIMFVGDDHRFKSHGWAREFLDAHIDSPLVYGNDLFQGENLPTACSIRSDVIAALGYAVLPDLRHLYIDNFWLALGKRIGISYLEDVIIEHEHPAAGKGEDDEDYATVNSHAMYEHDRNVFEKWLNSDGPAHDEYRFEVYTGI